MALSAPAAGRASCHISHTKSIAGRRGTLDEMMREIVPGAVKRYAKKNANIVVAEEAANESYVNDGEGGFRPCTDIREVMEYGDARAARLSRKITKDKKNKRGEMRGGTVTTTTFLVHLPRTMCVKQEDFYPAINPRTGKRRIDPETGEPASRSRWVARDKDEAEEYFSAVLEYLGANVVPGGMNGILGVSIQYSESTPHMHVLADTFGDDPKRPGMLRQDWSRAYSEHRDVRDEEGRRVPGWEKIRDLHVGLREHLIANGFEVEREFSERSLENLAKAEYVASMQALDTAEETLARVAALEPEARAEAERLLAAAREKSRGLVIDAELEGEEIITRAELDADDLMVAAHSRAENIAASVREQGKQEGREEGKKEVANELDRASALATEAEQHLAAVKTSKPLSGEQARALYAEGVRVVAESVSKRVEDAAIRRVIDSVQSAHVNFAESDKFADFAKAVTAGREQRRERTLDRQQRSQRVIEQRLNEASTTTKSTTHDRDSSNDSFERG